MKFSRSKTRLTSLPLVALLAVVPACGGKSKVADVGPDAQKPELANVQFGRLADVYAYQRIDASVADRRLRLNRALVLVEADVVIDPNLATDALFDAAGAEVPTANFELRPFDKSVGHAELVILWDNREGPEKENFDRAFESCQSGLAELPPSFRGQNTQLRPVPVVPRDAALRLQFTGNIQVGNDFFQVNPSAVQLLEFKGDPEVVSPTDAFRILPYRAIAKDDHFIIDTTILGGEGTQTTAGLPQSTDRVTANIRIAIPSRGSVVSSFYIKEDPNTELNGIDSTGRGAVIRDFRSGNEFDGTAGKLPDSETPMIVGSLPMGITAIDVANRVITLNKRLSLVPVRGRYPFVDGPLNSSGIPLGPVAVPTVRPLRSGDILTQDLLVTMPDGSIESVTVRAEILQNLEIGTESGSASVGRPLQPGVGSQGEALTTVRVRVASLEGGRDSQGRVHTFEKNDTPQGRDCVLQALYYEGVPFGAGSEVVSDAQWRHFFVRIEPQPQVPPGGTPGTLLNPMSSLAIEFTKPLDLEHLDNTANLLITNTRTTAVPAQTGYNQNVAVETFAEQMTDPKFATARVVPTRLADVGGDGTLLRLQPHMGFYHRAGNPQDPEHYSIHVKLGVTGVLDLAGNPVAIFDDPTAPMDSWSFDFTVDPAAPDNLVGWHTYNFTDVDEDGTLPGSIDIFGQFRMQDGRLLAASGVRFSRTADNQNLGSISRIHRGECWDPDFDPVQAGLGPLSPQGLTTDPNSVVPTDNQGAPHPGMLYWQPRMFDQVFPPGVPQVYEYYTLLPQKVGRIIEPLNPRGTRMQMRHIEDDFSLDYHQAAEFGIDVDQLYWSTFDDETVFFDVFDRFSMSLGHAKRRPDEAFLLIPGDSSATPPLLPACRFVCSAINGGLSTVFADNVLDGTAPVSVIEDRVYQINPNAAFRSPLGVKYVPYPRFDRSYTWRDSRLVTVDASGEVIGLGGAQQPGAPEPNDDWTAHISSPWITDDPPANFVAAGLPLWCLDEGDFKGNMRHDHDPIALPLLVDFKMFPDSPANGLAAGSNSFQVAMLGPPTNGLPAASGYYDTLGAGCSGRLPWPRVRVQASGGEDLITGAPILIDPANRLEAQPSILKDAGLGNAARALFSAPPGDGMMNWAQADFVRKVSTMTFGFVDTLQPQRAVFVDGPAPLVSSGFPDLLAVSPNLRIGDFITQLDPPQGRQPAGTSVVLEVRGAEAFDNSNALYNPIFERAGYPARNDSYDGRGNLLNANYACEAYRYSQANHAEGFSAGGGSNVRVAATGLTRYVTEDQLQLIRDPATGLLPRYMNMRLVMTNNVDVTPAVSPSLRSMSFIYRMQSTQ